MVTRFLSTPRESYVWEVKWIFRYLKSTLYFSLWCPKGEEFTLIAYTNSNWEGCINDRKSTRRYALFLGNYLVS